MSTSHRRTFLAVLGLFVLTSTPPTTAQRGQEPLRALFIGNSQTSRQEVPNMVAELSEAAGIPFHAERITRGGETFERHVERDDPQSPLARLTAERWDFVVLQENTRLAAAERPAPLPHFSIMHARPLVDAARAAGARPVFYMTWAYRGEPERLGPVRRNYETFGATFDADVAPAGVAWSRALAELPDLDLYDPDGEHANPAGAYLAACVLFATLHGRSPEGLPAADGVSAEAARRLQRVAWEVYQAALRAD